MTSESPCGHGHRDDLSDHQRALHEQRKEVSKMLGAPIPPVVTHADPFQSGSLMMGLVALVVVLALTIRWFIKLRGDDDRAKPEPEVQVSYRAAA
jgi:hypothetical protein